MRGKDPDREELSCSGRITPAHAGKRAMVPPLFLQKQDHPCACGEKKPEIVFCQAEKGSPPRMRGKAMSQSRPTRRAGITPAHAGKRPPPGRRAPPGRDHPRACGEKYIVLYLFSDVQGSPPRMRGKDKRLRRSRRKDGITPAHAGKRRFPAACQHNNGDHPRACGEKSAIIAAGVLHQGSPPRMRGKAQAKEALER